MNNTSHKMPVIWATIMFAMSLLYACTDADGSGDITSGNGDKSGNGDNTITINAGDITYDNDRFVQGTTGTATPSSSTITDFSGLTFSIASISTHTGTQVPPAIAEDGIITVAADTTAGSYQVTITPDGSTVKGTPITLDFYVIVKPTNTGALDTALQQAISAYGPTGDFNYIDTSTVTDMSHLFRIGYAAGSGGTVTLGIGVPDAARTYVTDFNGDISKWDVSSVEDFSYMFAEATEFNQDISGWDVSTGTDFSYMFYGATKFNQDLSDWSVNSTDDTTDMFTGSGVTNLPAWYTDGNNTPAPTLKAGDIQYDKTKIAQDAPGTATPSSTTITDFSGLTFSIASINTYVGAGTQTRPAIAENGVITTTASTTAGPYRVTITPDGIKILGTPITIDFSVTVKPANIGALDTVMRQAITDYGLTGDFNYIDTSAVTDMSFLFAPGYTQGTGSTDATRTYMANFNGDISKWNVSAVEDFSYMFAEATAFNQNISGWDVSAGTDFSYMFNEAATFNQDLSDWSVDSTDDTTNTFLNSGVTNLPAWYAGDTSTTTPTLKAGDIQYDKTKIAQDAPGTATPSSTTITDFSGLTFSIASINAYVGTGTQTRPAIAENGVITTAADTTAGLYRVTITPDGSTILGNPITVDFSVTVKPTNTGALDTALKQGIADYGLTGNFNYIDTSAVTNMAYLFAPTYTPGSAGTTNHDRSYIQGFNGDISKWDVSAVENFRGMFIDAAVFNQNIGDWDVSAGKNFSFMFTEAAAFNQNISGWTVSAGENFAAMFQGAAAFNQNIGDWKVSSGKDFSLMFDGATAFNQNISGWTVSGGTNFAAMFQGATAFNQDIGDWDVSSGTNFAAMFQRATTFNNGGSSDIGKWTVSAGTNFDNMFHGATAFNQNISDWDVLKGKNFSGMFQGATAFNQNIGGWNVSAGTNFSNMFNGATLFNQDLSAWSVDATDDTTNMFLNSGMTNLPLWYQSYTLKAGDITYDYDRFAQGTAGTATPSSETLIGYISSLTFSIASISTHAGAQVPPAIVATNGTITTTTNTTAGSYRITITPDGFRIVGAPITLDFYVTVKPANIGELDTTLETAIANYGLTGDFNYIDTSAVRDMSWLFRSGYTPGTGAVDATRTYVEGFNGDISKWDVSGVKNFTATFYGATAFNKDIGDWDVSGVKNFTATFYGATAFNKDIGDWDVSAGTDFTYMFYGATAFNQNIFDWDVSSVENFKGMFYGATAFNQNISWGALTNTGWDVSSGTDFSEMFQGATAFNNGGSPAIGNWNVSSGKNFANMFHRATAFNRDVSHWNVSSGEYFNDMFHGATAFNQDIGDWKVSAGTNFSRMFQEATSFNQDISEWAVSAGTDFSYMFYGATAFNNGGSPDIGKWNVSSGENFSGMFQGATAFNQNIGGWNVSVGTNFSNMFREASSFNQNIGGDTGWDVSSGENFSGMFWEAAAFNQNIGDWDVSSGTNFSNMFRQATKFDNGGSSDIGKWNVSSGENFSYMFAEAISFNQNIGGDASTNTGWDVSAGTNFSRMFQGAKAFNQNIGDWDVSSGIDFSYMFQKASRFNQNIGDWTVSAGTNFSYMFQGASKFNQDLTRWQLASTVTQTNMFEGSGVTNPPSWYQ